MTRVFLRLALILAGGAGLGLAANAASGRPVPLRANDGPGAWPERAERISISQLEAGRRALLLLDVRSESAFRLEHPAEALHAAATSFLEEYRKQGLASVLKAADGVVVVCESDGCSAGDRVAKLLRDLGHPKVRVLEGGWEAYRRSSLPKAGP